MAEKPSVLCRESTQNMENETREESSTTANSCPKKQKDWKADTDIDLFLLGKTGNGKSATGNSILLRQAFDCSLSMNSVTTDVDFDFVEFEGRVIKIVDVRGVKDTRETTARSTALFIRDMEYAIMANPRGYHAFLIVLKYGNRFNKEEVDTIKFLKAVFGETFVKDHCIIVMTGGDFFYEDHILEGLSFTNWCEQETDNSSENNSFKEFLQECSHRIVLFNNWSDDEDEKKKQLVELLSLVDQLKGTRYTDDKFKQANLAQTELIMKCDFSFIREYALKEESLILQKLKSCQESISDEQDELENLLVRAEALMQNLSGLDKKTKLLEKFIESVGAIKSNISSEIKVCVDIKEWRTSFRDEQIQMELKTKSEKEKLTSQYSKSIAGRSGDIKIQLTKELEEKIKNCDKNLEKGKKDKETEFFREINKRREKLKLKRQKQEAQYQEIKSNYIANFLSSLLNGLSNIFSALKRMVFRVE